MKIAINNKEALFAKEAKEALALMGVNAQTEFFTEFEEDVLKSADVLICPFLRELILDIAEKAENIPAAAYVIFICQKEETELLADFPLPYALVQNSQELGLALEHIRKKLP